MKKPEEILGVSDIAKVRGVKRQTIQTERLRSADKGNGWPHPDFMTPGNRPFWRRKTLEEVGLLEPRKKAWRKVTKPEPGK